MSFYQRHGAPSKIASYCWCAMLWVVLALVDRAWGGVTATALPNGAVVNTTHYREGVGCGEASIGPAYDVAQGCFRAGVHATGCRRLQPLCTSTQMVAATLHVDSSAPLCIVSSWTWVCAADTLVWCARDTWCSPLATCNASACLCRNNLTLADDGATCACAEGYYLHQVGSDHACLPVSPACAHAEVAPATITSDRWCAMASTDEPATPTKSVPSAEGGGFEPLWLLAVPKFFIPVVVAMVVWRARRRRIHP